MSIVRLLQLARATVAAALVGVVALTPALAQDDPPGRVGRVADLNGGVSWFDADEGQWTEAERNRPLTGGDRISTAIDGRAELRVGSTVLRLSNSSELEVLRLDDDKLVFQLHAGSVAVRVRSREVADEIELLTAEARLLPQRAGHYRVDRIDDTTLAGGWRGELRVADTPWQVGSGQRIELVRENRGKDLRQAPSRFADDGFAAWVLAEDSRDNERTAANRYVSPEMTGAEDLDRHGRWDQHPEYGAIWYPVTVQSDWAPYRYGRWAWVRPWGWTWVDAAPWGFAPFHYGRWVHWRNHWGWVPGAYVARPVYAPALVAWIGGPHLGFSIRIGGPAVGWVPLAPREAYRPYYRHTPIYVDRVNPGPRDRWHHHPQHPNSPGGRPDRREKPWVYGNQAVPGAVTVVPGDVLVRRQPVARAVIDVRDQRAAPDVMGPPRPTAQLAPVAPPPGPPAAAPRADRVDRRDDRRDESREQRRDDDRRDNRREERRDDRRDARPEMPVRALPQLPAPAQAAPQTQVQPQPQTQAPAQRVGPSPVMPPNPAPNLRDGREHRDRDRERNEDGLHGRQRPGFGPDRPAARQDSAAVADHPVRAQTPAVQAPPPQRAQPPAPQPQAPPQAATPPAPRAAPPAAPVERAGPPRPAPSPAARAVAAPPAAAPAVVAPPPAARAQPPETPRPSPRERDDERKGRPEAVQRSQAR